MKACKRLGCNSEYFWRYSLSKCAAKCRKLKKYYKKGLQLWFQKVTWAGTQCSDFFPQARLILCQCIDNFAALGLYCFYVNILICTACKSVIAEMPLSGAYNQKMAAIRLILTTEYERLGPNFSV